MGHRVRTLFLERLVAWWDSLSPPPTKLGRWCLGYHETARKCATASQNVERAAADHGVLATKRKDLEAVDDGGISVPRPTIGFVSLGSQVKDLCISTTRCPRAPPKGKTDTTIEEGDRGREGECRGGGGTARSSKTECVLW